MTDLAALGLTVRSDGVVVATEHLDRFRRSSDRAADGVDRVERRSGALSGALSRLARAANPIILAATTAFGLGAAVPVLANFDSAMSRAAAITRATAIDLAALRATAVDLGTTTEFTAAQAADGLSFLGMAGFTAAESIAALPATLDLATAAGMGLGEAADTTSNIMSAFNIQAAEAASVTDVLAAASTRANTNVAQLGQAISTAGPIAATLGIQLADTAAAIGVMSDAGIQGERAGTALRGVLASLAGPTTQAQEALAEYGLTAAHVDPATRSLADVMLTLRDAGLSTADAMTIFGREAASGALVMIQGAERLREFGQELRNVDGAAGEMAATMRDNLRGDLQGASSAAEGLIIALGDAGLTAALRATIQWLTSFIRGLSLMVGQVSDAVGAINRLFSAQARIEQQIDNTRVAMDDERRAVASLTDAMGPGMQMSIAMANTKLDEALARRANIQAIIDEQRALGMASSAYGELTQQIDYLRMQSSALANTGRDGGAFAPSANRADIEWQTREIMRLAEERERLLDPSGQSANTLRDNERVIRQLQEAIAGASDGMVTFGGATLTVTEATDRLNISMAELPETAGGAARSLASATEAAAEAAFDLNKSLASAFANGLANAKSLSDVVDSLGGAIRNVLSQLASTFLNRAFSNVFNNLFPSLGNIQFRESGGPVSAGQAYVVGEKRPELFVPRTSGTILPSVPQAAGSGGAVVQIINNTGQPVRQESSRTPDGREVIRAVIGEELGGGGADKPLGRFGLSPKPVRRA